MAINAPQDVPKKTENPAAVASEYEDLDLEQAGERSAFAECSYDGGRRYIPSGTNGLKVLLTDPDSSRNSAIVDTLRKAGSHVTVATDCSDALAKIRSSLPDVVLAALNLQGVEITGFIALTKEISPEIEVFVITELNDLDCAIECTKNGADGFIVRPNITDQVTVAVAKAKERKQLRELAHTDGLTSLFNRRTFYHFLSLECHRAKRHGHLFGLLLLDLDNFKQYNDFNGHLVGDIALIKLGRLLRSNTRATDIPARYGGDEFAVILTEIVSEQAVVRAKRMRDMVSVTRFQHESNIPGKKLTVSIGVALCPAHGSTPFEVMQSADKALYRAKAEGGNRVCVFEKFEESRVQKC